MTDRHETDTPAAWDAIGRTFDQLDSCRERGGGTCDRCDVLGMVLGVGEEMLCADCARQDTTGGQVDTL